MKRKLKQITLKEDTLNDINTNNINLDTYVKRISNYLSNANYLIDNKMEKMDSIELLDSLNKVFEIYFEPNDYLKILSIKNKKHYNRFVNIKTRMYDENNYNITYYCAITNKINCNDCNIILDLYSLRKYTNSEDIVIIKPFYTKEEKNDKKKDKYEKFNYDYINIYNPIIEKDNNLYPYAAELVRKNLIAKDVLYELKIYIDEVAYQRREINGLAFDKTNQEKADIGLKYKKAFDRATNNREIPKTKKISVPNHKKIKK